ncbi:hypothetical protein B0T20DRAFT_451013 [Sordaria brevicollis]|uniref:Xylanolytic transcriptional activator regulatory domain-containing protein n=1 Tax=Sordaria brevicollis TaxID=83679 RepID=A0AAE0PLW1_SORBR|nr:hypothetical protein B0T20DRAFT_451013 [Sordaria brevicollis]
MASLKFIMDVNDDHPESHHINKKDVASDHPVNPGQPHGPPPYTQLPPLPPTTLPPITIPRYDSSSGSSMQIRDISLAVASSQTKDHGLHWEFKNANTAPSSVPPNIHTRSTMRRRSTASNDSVDQTGYASASSSSLGGNYHQSNTSMRPMPSQPHTPELPMRLTPITGRVSRARKGIPVHVCDICRPPKVRNLPRVSSARPVGSTSAETETRRLKTVVHPLHHVDLQHQGRIKDHRVDNPKALPLPTIKYCPKSQHQERRQSLLTLELKVCISIPVGFNTAQPYHLKTITGRLNRLGHCRYSQEWIYPFQKPRNPGITLLRLPPQVIQQLQYLAGKFGQVQDALLEPSYGLPGAPFPLDDIGIFDASADHSYSTDGVGYENGNLIALSLPIGNGCGFPGTTLPMSFINPLHDAVPRYLEVYWERVHPLFPVVHRASFEEAPEEVLRYAMAAVATQFLENDEDRVKGNEMHDYVAREVKKIPAWNIQVLQAIFLYEYFARFRGQNAVIRPSGLFQELYKRPQLEVSEQTYLQGAFDPQVLYHYSAALDYTASPSDRPVNTSWKNWVDAEARRRLLAACFFLDGHAAIYQQQPQAGQTSVDSELPRPSIPLMGPSLGLWEASSPASWAKILAEDPSAGVPVFLDSAETITPDFVSRQISIDRMIILVSESLRFAHRHGSNALSASTRKSSLSEVDPQLQYMHGQLSPAQQELPYLQPDFLQSPHSRTCSSFDMETRINSLFFGCPIANTYLALHHTPLHDLLAVSGDSWLFTEKVLPAAKFANHLRRLKAWAENHHHRPGGNTSLPTDMSDLSMVKATMYAARSILEFLSPVSPGVSRYAPTKGAGREDRPSFWGNDLSDFWALYVCALIIWAFGHKARPVAAATAGSTRTVAAADAQLQHHQHSAKRRRTGNSEASFISRHGQNSVATADQQAMNWLRMLAADNVTGEDIIRARSRRETMGVVSLVRRRLDSDCIGGKNRLYVEAVGILRRLEEDGERNDKPWF